MQSILNEAPFWGPYCITSTLIAGPKTPHTPSHGKKNARRCVGHSGGRMLFEQGLGSELSRVQTSPVTIEPSGATTTTTGQTSQPEKGNGAWRGDRINEDAVLLLEGVATGAALEACSKVGISNAVKVTVDRQLSNEDTAVNSFTLRIGRSDEERTVVDYTRSGQVATGFPVGPIDTDVLQGVIGAVESTDGEVAVPFHRRGQREEGLVDGCTGGATEGVLVASSTIQVLELKAITRIAEDGIETIARTVELGIHTSGVCTGDHSVTSLLDNVVAQTSHGGHRRTGDHKASSACEDGSIRVHIFEPFSSLFLRTTNLDLDLAPPGTHRSSGSRSLPWRSINKTSHALVEITALRVSVSTV